MGGLRKLLITGAVLCTLFAMINGGLVIGRGRQHDRFFKKLNEQEKQALISLAISRFHVPESSNHTGLFPEYPITKPKAEEIPNTLFTTMMNGGVPKEWMKEFIAWLRRTHRMTDASFVRYLTDEEDRLCRGEGDDDCVTVETLSKGCCPFG